MAGAGGVGGGINIQSTAIALRDNFCSYSKAMYLERPLKNTGLGVLTLYEVQNFLQSALYTHGSYIIMVLHPWIQPTSDPIVLQYIFIEIIII